MKLNFALFKNDKKQGNQPDMRSQMTTPIQITEPGEYRVAGWFKDDKNGKKYLSCILEKVEPGQSHGPSRDENVAMIQRTRQALEGNSTDGYATPGPSSARPSYPHPQRPAQPDKRYGNPQRPPDPAPEDDLPF